MAASNMTRRTILGGLAATFGLGAAGGTSAAETLTLRARNKYGVPALGAMIVTPDGFDMLEVAGVRRVGEPTPVTKQDLWHLGSNGKAMTAALYARLVEAGKANWGALLGDLFSNENIDPAWKTVTIEELFSHTSGISDAQLMVSDWLMQRHADKRPLPAQRAEAAATVLSQKSGGARGDFAYANANYILAGAAMERATDTAWEELMRRYVFGPLGMTSAGFGAPKSTIAPSGHREPWYGFGPLQPIPTEEPGDNPAAMGPAGTMHMNLEDYGKFLRVFFGGYSGGFLSPGNIAHLTKPAAEGDQSYAMGWLTFKSRPWAKGPALAHEGSNTLWHAFTAVGPARQRAIVTVCNAHQGGGAAATQGFGLELIKGLL